VPKKKRNKQKQSNPTPSPKQTLLVKPSNLKPSNSQNKPSSTLENQSKENRFGRGYKKRSKNFQHYQRDLPLNSLRIGTFVPSSF
ncbi:hypothetical protein AKJ51_02025, partial [candidate division MSBL1 archaeon SCGC-AAA382A20]